MWTIVNLTISVGYGYSCAEHWQLGGRHHGPGRDVILHTRPASIITSLTTATADLDGRYSRSRVSIPRLPVFTGRVHGCPK